MCIPNIDAGMDVCIEQDPTIRSTAPEILRHSFLQELVIPSPDTSRLRDEVLSRVQQLLSQAPKRRQRRQRRARAPSPSGEEPPTSSAARASKESSSAGLRDESSGGSSAAPPLKRSVTPPASREATPLRSSSDTALTPVGLARSPRGGGAVWAPRGGEERTFDLTASNSRSSRPAGPQGWGSYLSAARGAAACRRGISSVKGASREEDRPSSGSLSVDAARSVAFCHGGALASSAAAAASAPATAAGSAADRLPLLKPPAEGFAYRTPSGDVVVGGIRHIILGTTIRSANGSDARAGLRLAVPRNHLGKLLVAPCDVSALDECRRSLAEAELDGGCGSNSVTEPPCFVSLTRIDENDPNWTVYSIRSIPSWLSIKYLKLYRSVEILKCRLPRFVLYMSETDDLPPPGTSLNKFRGNNISNEDTNSRTHAPMQCKCMIMANEPFPDFCVQWADGVRLRYSLQSGRLYLSAPSDPPGQPLFQWDGEQGSPYLAVPAWIDSAPDIVRKYLLMGQKAMQRCMLELDNKGVGSYENIQKLVLDTVRSDNNRPLAQIANSSIYTAS